MKKGCKSLLKLCYKIPTNVTPVEISSVENPKNKGFYYESFCRFKMNNVELYEFLINQICPLGYTNPQSFLDSSKQWLSIFIVLQSAM